MRHFDFLSDDALRRLFHREPGHFAAGDDPGQLGVALGATLYIPASRQHLARDIAKQAGRGVLSMVLCLEDAVPDRDLQAAECNLVTQLREYAQTGASKPLVFVRVRNPEQVPKLVTALGEHAGILTGFVLPKFTETSGAAFLDAVVGVSEQAGRSLLVMPVLESPDIIYAENRISELLGVRDLLAKYPSTIAAIRLGATDLSAVYGLRRSRDLTVYDVRVLADVIADVVNIFARADGSGYVVTGPVWEYITSAERMFKPQLRESPFIEHADRGLRAELIAKDLDGLIREIALDKANGLTGKTVIHPSHVAAVHALLVVTHEEYCDAVDILDTGAGGGVAASAYRNKMNESKPHTAWAGRIVQRAEMFGVAHESTSFVDLLGAGLNR
ncbi:MAG: HpcH/HpaI aldolase/citrate lyase family protein [Jatrophihabitantaceae bacterium]